MVSPVRKRFGQNFLTDQLVIDRIFDLLAIQPYDRVLEIGPGRGALTANLRRCTKHVDAVELDRDLASELSQRLPDIHLINEDVLRIDPSEFHEKRIVGNLPYEISTPLLTKLIDIPEVIDMHFMLQREVAMRLVASPGTKAYGRLSVIVQLLARVSLLFDVEPESFHPIPGVRSTFVRLVPKSEFPEDVDAATFKNVVRVAFSQRRKTLKNSLKSLEIEWDTLPVDAQLRADQVTIDDYLQLARSIQN